MNKKANAGLIIILLLLAVGAYFYFQSGGFDKDKSRCDEAGGDWVPKTNCNPGGCDGGYCKCPSDTSKWLVKSEQPDDSLYNRCWGDDGLTTCFVGASPVGCLK